jgi:hypothetical protein
MQDMREKKMKGMLMFQWETLDIIKHDVIKVLTGSSDSFNHRTT